MGGTGELRRSRREYLSVGGSEFIIAVGIARLLLVDGNISYWTVQVFWNRSTRKELGECERLRASRVIETGESQSIRRPLASERA